ncbi:hypothetical protein NLI96_g413 [Meripilus lineatus]|uniref:Uncharacterized protein n=1 Tax=Meripilus lineatus TaxID=2056292 RepID=A0AAD5VEE7_9APHY|nr:hypothetical protein NLI96_g413 [Physisporinus lineatus]
MPKGGNNWGYGSGGSKSTSSGTNSQVRRHSLSPLPIFLLSSDTISPGPLYSQPTSVLTYLTSQGNHWCTRSGESGGSGYHYSNTNGSYYYSNPDGSTYYNNGGGGSTYTAPNGNSYSK